MYVKYVYLSYIYWLVTSAPFVINNNTMLTNSQESVSLVISIVPNVYLILTVENVSLPIIYLITNVLLVDNIVQYVYLVEYVCNVCPTSNCLMDSVKPVAMVSTYKITSVNPATSLVPPVMVQLSTSVSLANHLLSLSMAFVNTLVVLTVCLVLALCLINVTLVITHSIYIMVNVCLSTKANRSYCIIQCLNN